MRQPFGDYKNDSRSLGSGKKSFGGSRSYTSVPFKTNMMGQSKTKSKGDYDDLDASSKGNNNNKNSMGSNMFMNLEKEAQTMKHIGNQ